VSFTSPLFLLAGVSLPILWLLARRERRRRTVPVSGLLLWRRLGLPPDPPRQLARRRDRLLLLRLAAAALATLGMAGPRVGGGAPAGVIEVLLDTSPSMGAFAKGAEEALAAVRGAVGPNTVVSVHRAPGTGDVAALLARHPAGSVVVVTDHRPPDLPEGGRVRFLLVGRPVENAGIVSAALAADGEDKYAAVLRNFGRAAREVVVSRPGGPDRILLAPGEARLLAGPAPDGKVEISITPGDAFAFDDRVVLERALRSRPALRAEGELHPKLRAALFAAGMLAEGPGEGEVVSWRRPPAPTCALVVAPPGETRPVTPPVTGSGDLGVEAVPPPGVPLGATVVLAAGGVPLLSDAAGPLAVLGSAGGRPRVVLALDPGDPSSDWSSDPSFPVFIAEVGRLLGFETPGSRIVAGVVDPEESATAPEGAPLDLAGLSTGPGAAAGSAPMLRTVLLLLAAALLVLHAFAEARTAGPPGGNPVKGAGSAGR
jgi:hypothetical protein